jgi:hypothetical protein
VVIVGWSLTFLLPIALLAFGTVTQGDDGPWMFSLFFLAPVVALGFLLLTLARREVPYHRIIGLVHIVTFVIAARVLPGYWLRVTLARDHVGAGFSPDVAGHFDPEWWHGFWPPVMTLLVFCAVLFNILAWMRRTTA